MGRLGRSRVCAIHRGGVDFQGVIYIPFDAEGAWRTKLAQELVEAKLPIKVEALIQKRFAWPRSWSSRSRDEGTEYGYPW